MSGVSVDVAYDKRGLSPHVLRDASVCWPVVDKWHAQADAPDLCLCNYPVQGSKDPLIKDPCLWLQRIPLWTITCVPSSILCLLLWHRCVEGKFVPQIVE